MSAGSRHNVLLGGAVGGALSYPIVPGLEFILDSSVTTSPILATGALLGCLYAYTRTPEFTIKHYRLQYYATDKILRKELANPDNAVLTQPLEQVVVVAPSSFGVRKMVHDLETRLIDIRQNVTRLDNLWAKHNNMHLVVGYPFDAPLISPSDAYNELVAQMEARIRDLQGTPEWKNQELAWVMHQEYEKAKAKIEKLKTEKRRLQEEREFETSLGLRPNKPLNNQAVKATITLGLALADQWQQGRKK